ncbi:hypothetical protein ASF28_08820 [Methylobacterium sp. Leaf99]|nr:hypothetical protein ASF28_08820 [Methylobacterium sp. Leaf99]
MRFSRDPSQDAVQDDQIYIVLTLLRFSGDVLKASLSYRNIREFGGVDQPLGMRDVQRIEVNAFELRRWVCRSVDYEAEAHAEAEFEYVLRPEAEAWMPIDTSDGEGEMRRYRLSVEAKGIRNVGNVPFSPARHGLRSRSSMICDEKGNGGQSEDNPPSQL